MRNVLLFGAMGAALAAVGFLSSWTEAVSILNLCLISALMALGVNMQWGYAGLFNVGIMGFAALGGVAAVLVSMPPVAETWAVGGAGIGLTVLALIATVAITLFVRSRLAGRARAWATFACVVIGYFAIREVFDPAVDAIEATDAARTGYLGGLGLPIMLAWVVGGAFAAGAAWIVGKIALGLRADYLAIATLGISEIIVALLKNEDWLSRGVKNVTALPRPVPYEVDLQAAPWFNSFAAWLGGDVISLASIFVQLSYGLLFTIVLLIVLWFAERALKSPWGRMMRAIRDNRDAAAAMGKNVTKRHLQVFVLGSAVVGLAGAMMTTLDGQFTPGSYQPLRFTFLIWVMVIVGGSGNNWGSILGGFLIWFLWIEAEPVGRWLTASLGDMLPADSPIRAQLIDAASYLRPLVMGTILLLVLRFSPKGLIPEKH